MKRYLVFFGDDYYPLGGMDDFVGDFDSLDEAISAAIKEACRPIIPQHELFDGSWASIFDSELRIGVWRR